MVSIEVLKIRFSYKRKREFKRSRTQYKMSYKEPQLSCTLELSLQMNVSRPGFIIVGILSSCGILRLIW